MTALGDAGPVVVVGAGPAGALLALYLARQGLTVEVFESRPDLRRADIEAGRSINLALATRGIVPLTELGLIDKVDAITIPMRGRMVHPGDPSSTASLQPYGTKPGDVIHSVSRTGLNAILLDAAEATGKVRITFSMRCREVDVDRRLLLFTDESAGNQGGATTEVRFGTIFGCDGASSVVRPSVVEANGGSTGEEPLDHGYKELRIPPGPDGRWLLDPNALHIWPRQGLMLIALANPPGDFTATLFMPLRSDTDSFEAIERGGAGAADGAIDELFARHFDDAAALMPDLAEQFEANRTGHLSTIRTTGWSVGDRAVLVGDAAHAIVPFHGQGMNAAMESCRLLDRQLRRHRSDVEHAFTAFEAERRPDTDAIADMALANYVEMRAGVTDPEYLLRRELALELERRHPDRVAARYGMVMFTTMPYTAVQQRAERQQLMLTELTAGANSLSEINFERAAVLADDLGPLPAWV